MRKRTFSLLCLCILLASLASYSGQAQSGTWSIQVLEADAHHLLLELHLPSFESEPVTHEGTAYQRLRVPGWGNWGQPGEPQLPMCSVPLGMPWPGTPQVSVVEVETETLHGYRLYPVPALELGGTPDAPQIVEAFALDAAAYDVDAFYPGSLAEATSIGFLRDQPLFQLRLYPLQYNPRQQALHVHRRLRVQVVFPDVVATSVSLPTASLPGPSPAEADRGQQSPPWQADVFARILQRTLLNGDSLPAPPLYAPPSPHDRTPVVPLDVGPQARLKVEAEGLYRVTYSDLNAVAPELVQVDPRLLELSNGGSAVPILFAGQGDGRFDAGDSFLFYGQAIDSDYTRQNVYWLQARDTPGLRMARRDGTPGAGSTPQAFADTRHDEQDRVYWRAVPGGQDKDHWFWDMLSASGSRPVSVDHAFDLRHIAASGPDGALRVALYGATYGDHLTQLYLNGVALLSGSAQAWPGQAEKVYEIPVSQSLLEEGTNHLRVENILPAGESSSEVYVNWFELTYQDTYVAEDDRLRFGAPAAGTYAFTLAGFGTQAIELLDITDPAAPVRIANPAIEPAGGGYRLRFSDSAAANQRYLAQGTDRLPTPAIELDEPSAWKSTANGATYLIVTHHSLYDAVLPLAAYREGQGETVAVVKAEDVYDEFNGGIRGPQAIRSFLEYAYQNWSPRPIYLLLVGDASMDPKNNLGSSLPDLLPACYVDTPVFGLATNDNWYARVHGDDDYPDLIVGRIPARYPSDVTTVANKVQTYEQAPPPGTWMRRAVLVADDGDALFAQDMDAVTGMLPEGITPLHMYGYDPGTSVQQEVSAGALLLAYSGHGTGSYRWGMWSDSHLIFDQTQMRDLGNGNRLPFMAVANCLNGWFDEYDRPRGMAEAFLLLNNRGGIASWAPASLGFPTPNSLMIRELHQALLADGEWTLGAAATSALVQAHLSRPDLPLSLLEIFTYLGDPAVRLNVPPTLALAGQAWPNPAAMGAQLAYTLTCAVSSGTSSGAGQARGLTLVNTLPQGVSYQSASPPPSSIYAQTLTWNLGDVPVGTYRVTITCQVGTNLAHGQTLQDQAHLYDANGGDRFLQINTIVHDSPIAGLAASNDGPTELGGATALSAATTSGTNVVYTWDPGDGSPTRSGRAIQHTYPAVGTYTARVTAANGVSSQAQTTTVTIVDVPPMASLISSSPDRLGQATAFQSTSAGTNLTCEWDWGDGSPPASSQEPAVTHTYARVGSFRVILTATNSRGSDVATGDVAIVEEVIAPVSSFRSSSPDELGQATAFVNASQDGGDEEENVSYAWDFGDGTSSTARHPSHTYRAAGTYLVSLTVTNSAGSNTFQDSVRVTDVPIGGLSIAHDSPAIVGQAVALSATATSGTGISYRWSLGDGTVRSGRTIAHAYGAVGSYTVVLTATNSAGSRAATSTVQVVDEAIAGLVLSNSGPTLLGSATAFAASTTAGTGISYLWDLGDGTASTEQNPAHTYGAVGEYTVVLTATNSLGSMVRYGTVSIQDVPISGLRIAHSGLAMLGSPITLTALVDAGTNVVYNWDLGDGHAATGPRIAHTYSTPGPQRVMVTAFNGAGESDASTVVVVLDPAKTAFFPLILKH